jgi:parallel beta-helix repeat protein
MLDQPVTAFDFTATPEGANPWIEPQSNGLVNVRFDRAGRYQLRAAVGGQTRTVNLTVNSVPTSIRATIGGRVLSQDTINEVRTMTPEIQAVVIDQFGQEMPQSGFEWSTGGAMLGPTADMIQSQRMSAEPASNSIELDQTNPSILTIKNGKLSSTISVKFISNTTPPILVSNATELNQAIKNAKGGEEILLKSGVNFGGIKIFRPNVELSSEVVIRSENASKPATVDWIAISEASKLRFENIDVTTLARFAAVTVSKSDQISFVGLKVTANLDPFKRPETLVDGFRVTNSSNVILRNSVVHNIGSGISVSDSSNTQILENKFERNLKDNINISSNVSDIEIRGNTLYSQLAVLYEGHHYDNIQFWVQTDAKQNTKNVKILDNTIFDLTGAVHAQSIFMRGNYVDKDGVQNPFKFENVEIAGNVIVTQQSNAIAVNDVDGLSVHSNTLVYSGDYTSNTEFVDVPGVIHSMSSNVRIFHNVLPERPNYAKASQDVFFDNTLYNFRSGELANLLVNPFGTNPTRENFATIPTKDNTASDGTIRGAMVAKTAKNTQPVFSMTPKVIDGNMVFELDARYTIAGAGIDLTKSQFQWTFADGTTATGPVITKAFSKAGIQDVKLTVKDSSGNESVLNKERVKVLSTIALNLDFENGMVDSESGLTRSVTSATAVLSQNKSGQSLMIGGTNGHIYVDPSDPNMAMIQQTRELSVSMSIMANRADNTSQIPLITKHGDWGLRLDATRNTIQLLSGSSRFNLQLSESVAKGSWVDLAFAWKDGNFEAFVNGKSAGKIALPKEQFDKFFQAGGYGLGIGGSGPWVDTRNQVKFGVDNLQVHTVGLSEGRVMEIRKSNLLTR